MIAGTLCTKHGHLDPADIYTYPGGVAKCRICAREHMAQQRARKRAVAAKQRGRIQKHEMRVYTLYQRTRLGIEEIVALPHVAGVPLWQHWGFTSAEEAIAALRLAWNEDILLQHDLSTAVSRARGLCSSCRVRAEERTRGCKICADRHRHRRLRGHPYIDVDGMRKAA